MLCEKLLIIALPCKNNDSHSTAIKKGLRIDLKISPIWKKYSQTTRMGRPPCAIKSFPNTL